MESVVWSRPIAVENRVQVTGDATAAFYGSIYYTVTEFSEFEIFRSNHIREELMTREEALSLVNIENIPRYESLERYSKTVGLDLEEALDVIHSIPKIWRSGGCDL